MKWNNKEKEFLKEKYEEMGLKWCCEQLERSKSSVSLMANRMGLVCEGIKQQKSDDEFLIKNYVKHGAEYCAEKLQRNKKQIIKRASALKLNPNRKWTQKERQFLKENYAEKGSKYCADILESDSVRITLLANSLGLTLDEETSKTIKREAMIEFSDKRSYDSYNVNPEQFLNITTPEVAYILGFIWADGHIKKHKSANTIKINISTKDFEELKKVFDKTGKWKYYHYTRKEGYKSTTITTNNRIIFDFLHKLDYINKSICSPEKVLKKIPIELHPYFFRGFSDGDGCFFYNNQSKYFVLAGSYEQDWSSTETLMNSLGVSFKIRRQINKIGHKSSVLTISNKDSIIKWGNYIYQNYENEDIGFKRKYDIFNIIKL